MTDIVGKFQHVLDHCSIDCTLSLKIIAISRVVSIHRDAHIQFNDHGIPSQIEAIENSPDFAQAPCQSIEQLEG